MINFKLPSKMRILELDSAANLIEPDNFPIKTVVMLLVVIFRNVI